MYRLVRLAYFADDAQAIKKGVQQQPHERRSARHPIDGVGLLAEVKVRRQGVLREMHGEVARQHQRRRRRDRKSTRLNSSHEWISYAVFCLKKKKIKYTQRT